MYDIPASDTARFAPGVRTVLKMMHGQTEYTLASVRLTSPCCNKLAIGCVSAASVEARAEGLVELTGETVRITVESADGASSLPLGTFRITECKAGESRTGIVGYDAASWALDGAYVPSTSNPPATALAVVADIAVQCSLTLGSTTGLTDQSVSGTLTGHTCREMLGYMAALVGCNAVVDRSGRLCLRGFSAGQSITPDNYYSGGLKLDDPAVLVGLRMVKKSKTTTTDVNGITTETDTTTTYTAGSGSGVVIEVDNPYATQAIVDAVWTSLHGSVTTYRTGSCSCFGLLAVEPGDLLSVTDTDGQTCVFPVMSAVLELDGGCKAVLSGSGETETSLSGIRGPMGRLLSRIEADIAAFKDLTADNFTAAVAKVDNLWADQAWVRNLFAQHLSARNLDVSGPSRFTGVVDAIVARFGGVKIAGGDYTAEFSDVWTVGYTPYFQPFQGQRGEEYKLVAVGIRVLQPPHPVSDTPHITFVIDQENPALPDVTVDTSGLRYGQDELMIPIYDNAIVITSRNDFIVKMTAEPDTYNAKVYYNIYTADPGSMYVEDSITAGGDLTVGDDLTVGGDLSVSGDLPVSGAISANTLDIAGQRVRANIAMEGISQSVTVPGDYYAQTTFDFSSILSGYPSDAFWYPVSVGYQGAFVLAVSWYKSGDTVVALYRTTISSDVTAPAYCEILIFY